MLASNEGLHSMELVKSVNTGESRLSDLRVSDIPFYPTFRFIRHSVLSDVPCRAEWEPCTLSTHNSTFSAVNHSLYTLCTQLLYCSGSGVTLLQLCAVQLCLPPFYVLDIISWSADPVKFEVLASNTGALVANRNEVLNGLIQGVRWHEMLKWVISTLVQFKVLVWIDIKEVRNEHNHTRKETNYAVVRNVRIYTGWFNISSYLLERSLERKMWITFSPTFPS
jgi:hypothetical protein